LHFCPPKNPRKTPEKHRFLLEFFPIFARKNQQFAVGFFDFQRQKNHQILATFGKLPPPEIPGGAPRARTPKKPLFALES
jgi:hypothetical protein